MGVDDCLRKEDDVKCQGTESHSFMDVCQTQHRNHAVASDDIGQCYDVVNHAFRSISLQVLVFPLRQLH